MKPDLVWFKSRNNNYDNELYDSVRGATNRIYSNTTDTQSSFANGLTSFDYNGFSIGNRTNLNGSGSTMVAWTWKAGGNKGVFNVDDVGYASAAAAGLTAGTITLVGSSVGTKQGFSIIQYQGNGTAGAQVPHGLTQTPDLTIIKAIDSVTDGSWFVGGNWAPGYGRLLLHSTAHDNGSPGNVVANDLWNNTAPTSSVVTLGGYNGVNDSGDDYIMYNWHNVPGLQKFGTYEGTGVAGNYVHLGFRPALIWIKSVDATSIQNWGIIDSTRSYANVGNHTLATNLSNPESYFGNGASVFGPNNKIDLLSDGFRLQETSGFGNTSGITFLYCAWAEAPSFNLYGGQSNAR